MKLRSRPAKNGNLRALGVRLLLLFVTVETKATFARDEWFRGLDLEHAVDGATLVFAARVVDLSETKVAVGGKGQRSIEQLKFEPVQVLKGVFSRETLTLTSDDLGTYRFSDAPPIELGQMRLLMLRRSSQGYAILEEYPSLEHAIPPLRDSNDPLLETVKVLLAVSESRDRARKVAMLLDGLRAEKGPSAIPLLAALERRALLAAQTPGVVEAVAVDLSDPSPAVREQAAKTLYALLDADYLDQPALREASANALATCLARSDSDIAARVAAFDALGAAGVRALNSRLAVAWLRLDRPGTFAEQAARLRAMGQLRMAGQRDAVLAFLKQLPLDAPPAIQYAAEWALGRLDSTEALKQVMLRLKNKFASGLAVGTEISLLGELPANAVPALLDISKLPLDHTERFVFAAACVKSADPRLVAPLAGMLRPRQQDVWLKAVEALTKIDTDDAAKALQAHLRDEMHLLRKLEIAEFLGCHGIRDGYPYAIEHMSEPYLREQAVAALAAIREPRAGADLRKILQTSNDIAWNSAAVRALGRLGELELGPQFFDMARNAKNPLVASALIALADLGEAKGLEIVREGFTSRNNEVLSASARAAGKLLALPSVRGDDVRDQLASLVVDPDAPQEARGAALDSLVVLNDARLDGALSKALRDAGLEGSDLLCKIEKLLRKRKVKLTLP